MHITLTRQQAQDLIDKIDANYEAKAVPLLDEAEKREAEAKSAFEAVLERLEEIETSEKYIKTGIRMHDLHCSLKMLGWTASLKSRRGFYKGNEYFELKKLLSYGFSDTFTITTSDATWFQHLAITDYSVSGYGGISDYKAGVSMGEAYILGALDRYKCMTKLDWTPAELRHHVTEDTGAIPKPCDRQPKKKLTLFQWLFGSERR